MGTAFVKINFRRSDAGLTLVELMIAMTIGLIIILIASILFATGFRNNMFRKGQVNILDNGRAAMQLLSREFSRVGYRKTPVDEMTAAFPAQVSAKYGCSFERGQVVSIQSSTDVCIRFQPRHASDMDCAGNKPNNNTGLDTIYKSISDVNQLMVERIEFRNETLYCNGEALVNNVPGVLFEYGIGNESDEERKITDYVAVVPDSFDTRSLRYSVLLRAGEQRPGSSTSLTSRFTCERWNNLTGTAQCNPLSPQQYEMISGYLMMRNLLP